MKLTFAICFAYAAVVFTFAHGPVQTAVEVLAATIR